ncbi:hypothetical protein CC78DRAFT_585076 [Lojkania enalia]|uniref:Uncharacterized protein n=1 Tax=Lojkania enalia TaxID=147567 RepID=A0A9P4N2X5_9PLEO|nr:hypothetical protein CC78DRAFT_585076 [Didymosphaeria enalia]
MSPKVDGDEVTVENGRCGHELSLQGLGPFPALCQRFAEPQVASGTPCRAHVKRQRIPDAECLGFLGGPWFGLAIADWRLGVAALQFPMQLTRPSPTKLLPRVLGGLGLSCFGRAEGPEFLRARAFGPESPQHHKFEGSEMRLRVRKVAT